jgi:hypothetical protein
MKIFVQNQGMRKILPQAYTEHSEDKILSIMRSLGGKIILEQTLKHSHSINGIRGRKETDMNVMVIS